MTEQEKTFIAKEFDKLENKLDSEYALYENGYQSALFDALEVVNKLPTSTPSQQSEQLKAFLIWLGKEGYNCDFEWDDSTIGDYLLKAFDCIQQQKEV
jgi:hypothetical protein